MIKEIKHAVNSSVGTPFFKSLSEIIKPNEVIFSVNSQISFSFTISPYVYYYNLSYSNKNALIKKFKSFGRGQIEIGSSANGNAHLVILQNGQIAYDTESTGIMRKNLTISYGDEIEIVASKVHFVHIKADQRMIYDNIFEVNKAENEKNI